MKSIKELQEIAKNSNHREMIIIFDLSSVTGDKESFGIQKQEFARFIDPHLGVFVLFGDVLLGDVPANLKDKAFYVRDFENIIQGTFIDGDNE